VRVSIFQSAYGVLRRAMWELLKGLPVRVEEWIRTHFSPKAVFFGVAAYLVLQVIGGAIQGESFELWKSLLSWLGSTHQNWTITNGLLTALVAGWMVATLFLLVSLLIYGADRRRLGQLEEVGAQSEKRRMILDQLGRQTVELRTAAETLTDENRRLGIELDARRKQAKLLDVILRNDRELLVLFSRPGAISITDLEAQALVESMLRSTFTLFGGDGSCRACVYTPDSAIQKLRIRWDYGLGQPSHRWNEWYIGDRDPKSTNQPRGIAGSVFVSGVDRANPSVLVDPDFVDAHSPRRSTLPYRSAIHTVIHPDDPTRKLGVLCIDSNTFVFSDADLDLVRPIATRLGWLLLTCEISDRKEVMRSEH